MTRITLGRMNLSQQALRQLPEALFDESIRDKMTNSNRPIDVLLDRSSADGPCWWEVVDLTRLVVANNQIEVLDSRIGKFEALSALDAHNNCIKDL